MKNLNPKSNFKFKSEIEKIGKRYKNRTRVCDGWVGYENYPTKK